MEIVSSPQALADQEYWKQTGNIRIMKRISALLTNIQQHPFTGIGKPEPWKGDLQGMRSRRITDEHRLVYFIASGMIYV